MVIGHLNNTPGYVEGTANNVHVVVSYGAPGGDYTSEEANNGLGSSSGGLGLGRFGDDVGRKLFRNHGLPRIARVGYVGRANIRVVEL